jgi:hypothetical protein
MKISKLPEWFCDNIQSIIMVGIVGVFLTLLCILIQCDMPDREKMKLFPTGTDVIVKGTDIHGTVVKWYPNDMVLIDFVSKDGKVNSVTYNYNLLQKQ